MNEDAKISCQALHWHFQQLLHTAQQRLDFLEFQLKESHDFEGNAYKSWVEAVAANIRQHLNEAEQFMEENSMANQPEHTPKGQISYNTGAKPASTRVGASSKVKSQNMKRIKHDQKLQAHNDGVKGAAQG